MPLDELFDDFLEPRRFETVLLGEWVIGGDPDVYPRWHSSQIGRAGGNYAGFSDPDVDRWLETGRQASDREVRRNAYLHFQARWAQEQPADVLYHPVYSFAVARDVVGVTADPAAGRVVAAPLGGVVAAHRRAVRMAGGPRLCVGAGLLARCLDLCSMTRCDLAGEW